MSDVALYLQLPYPSLPSNPSRFYVYIFIFHARVHVCVHVHVCYPRVLVCREFIRHRSVWQVALLASCVCSLQVLSWVKTCHIHLRQGTILQRPPLSLNTTSFNIFPKPDHSFTTSDSQFSPLHFWAACRNVHYSPLCAQILLAQHQNLNTGKNAPEILFGGKLQVCRKMWRKIAPVGTVHVWLLVYTQTE